MRRIRFSFSSLVFGVLLGWFAGCCPKEVPPPEVAPKHIRWIEGYGYDYDGTKEKL